MQARTFTYITVAGPPATRTKIRVKANSEYDARKQLVASGFTVRTRPVEVR